MKYWLHPNIKWHTFKELHNKTAVKYGGPTPKNFDKILWQMLRDRLLNIFITDKKVHGDTWFPTTKPIPKNAIKEFMESLTPKERIV